MLRYAALAACLGSFAASAQDAIRWVDSYKEAREQAKRTGKPIFLEFRCEA